MDPDRMANDRLQYVTERLLQLRGLILMPLSLLFLATGAYQAGVFRLPWDAAPNVPGRWFGVGLVLVIAAYYPITAWYRRSLGVATQSIRHSQLLPMLACMAVLPVASAIQGSLPFSAPMAVIALVVGGYGIRHYPVPTPLPGGGGGPPRVCSASHARGSRGHRRSAPRYVGCRRSRNRGHRGPSAVGVHAGASRGLCLTT